MPARASFLEEYPPYMQRWRPDGGDSYDYHYHKRRIRHGPKNMLWFRMRLRQNGRILLNMQWKRSKGVLLEAGVYFIELGCLVPFITGRETQAITGL